MARFYTHKTILCIIFVCIGVFAATGSYFYFNRQILILTDPVWDSLYIQQQSKDLLHTDMPCGWYIPRTKIVPLDIDGRKLRSEIQLSKAGTILLSPAVSAVFFTDDIAAFFKDRTFIAFSSIKKTKGPVYTNVLQVLIRPDDVSRHIEDIFLALEESGSAPEEAVFLSNKNSYLSAQVIREITGAVEQCCSRIRFSLSTPAEIMSNHPFTKDTFFILMPGSGNENRKIMDRLSKSGGRSIIFAGTNSLSAWPETVAAVIDFDLRTVLSEAIRKSGEASESGTVPMAFSVRYQ